jgi:hypothetical protein
LTNKSKHEAPYAIYANFECLTEKVDSADDPSEGSSTVAYQKHEPSGFTIYVLGPDGKPSNYKPHDCRGKDTITKLNTILNKLEKYIVKKLETNKPMVMTPMDESDFKMAHRCHLCRELLNGNKVRD